MISLQSQIQDDVNRQRRTVLIREIALDAGAPAIAPNLQEEGFGVVDIPCNAPSLRAHEKIAALIEAGRFHHDGNPVLRLDALQRRSLDGPKRKHLPRKLRPQNKIDAAVATIIAMSRAMVPAEENRPGAGHPVERQLPWYNVERVSQPGSVILTAWKAAQKPPGDQQRHHLPHQLRDPRQPAVRMAHWRRGFIHSRSSR